MVRRRGQVLPPNVARFGYADVSHARAMQVESPSPETSPLNELGIPTSQPDLCSPDFTARLLPPAPLPMGANPNIASQRLHRLPTASGTTRPNLFIHQRHPFN
ncbi:unnamed protein product [Peniophora sp. CBMAI 1063]|nr:unnamed protein product [Peniophora sp. CBMAI 1063]